jgi:hypothetical protein
MKMLFEVAEDPVIAISFEAKRKNPDLTRFSEHVHSFLKQWGMYEPHHGGYTVSKVKDRTLIHESRVCSVILRIFG